MSNQKLKGSRRRSPFPPDFPPDSKGAGQRPVYDLYRKGIVNAPDPIDVEQGYVGVDTDQLKGK